MAYASNMNKHTIIYITFIAAILIYTGSLPLYGSPIFPASDNQPINQIAEKSDATVETTPQNTSTETANLHKSTPYALAQIDVKILFGVNQDGGKSYKTTYQLTEVSGDQNVSPQEPQVRVTYKNKADQDKYAVEEVTVKKAANNAYQITANVVESKPGQKITPKVTWIS